MQRPTATGIPHNPSRTTNLHLTLFIPDLLPSSGTLAALPGDNGAPVLQRLFGRGVVERFPAIDSEMWLCQAFEVEQREDWPVAALTAAVDGLDTGSDWWLRADPLHLQLQRNQTRVIAAPALPVSEDDAAALTAALNAHFSAEGLAIVAAQPSRWYIRQTEPVSLSAPALSTLAGRPLPLNALTGSRASHWHRVLTEAQMVLHEHPANQAREARGLPAVNSLLLWGGGRKPAVPGRHFTQVWSDDTLATALAVQSGADSSPTPPSAALWSGNRPAADGRHLIMLDRAHQATRYGGPEAWLKAVRNLEELWFGPLWGALEGPLQELVLVATGPGLCLRCTLRPVDRLKFWKRAWPWTAIAGDAA